MLQDFMKEHKAVVGHQLPHWHPATLLHDVPRSTFTYLVEGFLTMEKTSLRNQILSRYPGFFRKLQMSPSKEVRMLAKMVETDPRSTLTRTLGT